MRTSGVTFVVGWTSCWTNSKIFHDMRRNDTHVTQLQWMCFWSIFANNQLSITLALHYDNPTSQKIMGTASANERRRYNPMSSLISCVHTQNDPCTSLSNIHWSSQNTTAPPFQGCWSPKAASMFTQPWQCPNMKTEGREPFEGRHSPIWSEIWLESEVIVKVHSWNKSKTLITFL